jgi:hypothetical protein
MIFLKSPLYAHRRQVMPLLQSLTICDCSVVVTMGFPRQRPMSKTSARSAAQSGLRALVFNEVIVRRCASAACREAFVFLPGVATPGNVGDAVIFGT